MNSQIHELSDEELIQVEKDTAKLANKISVVLDGENYALCANALLNLIVHLASELPNTSELLLISSTALLQAANEYKDKKTSE